MQTYTIEIFHLRRVNREIQDVRKWLRYYLLGNKENEQVVRKGIQYQQIIHC